MNILHDYDGRRGRMPCYGALATLAAGGTAAGVGAAASGAAAGVGATIGSGLAIGAGGVAGSALTVGGAAASAAGLTTASALGAGSIAATGLGGILGGLGSFGSGLLTAGKVGLALGSAEQSIQGGIEQKNAAKFAAKQAGLQGDAQAAEVVDKATNDLAINDARAAASGVVGGSGSSVASSSAILRGASADLGNIETNTRLRKSIYDTAKRRSMTLAGARASKSLFDAFTTSTDFLG